MNNRSKSTPSVSIIAQTPYLATAARQLAKRLAVPYLSKPNPNSGLYLFLTEQRLELHQGGQTMEGPVFADFISGKMGYRRARGLGSRQPLGRAVGLKKGHVPSILDATPGLGRDGFILACLGCSVRWVERSPLIAALLEDGLKRARDDDQTRTIIDQNISLEVGDGIHFMNSGLEIGRHPEEVVYLDPMYPHRTKSALVKKEMRRLRALVGDDTDGDDLLKTALNYAGNRVVVKRPHPSSPLGGLAPDFAITTKKSRFDIYLTQNRHP
ncbi:MAG: class I SAM-dependent methyltransferase [Magnetococcales bacterium]|nr:class I SAM-dependent methyltransferase [Magnetococcales bacterium]